jgi:hypothetical protein
MNLNSSITEALSEFECGTSLAEHEHYQNGDDKSTITPRALQQSAGGRGKVETIESLRHLLASDVLTDEGQVCTMFASPFEIPRGVTTASSSSQLSSSGNKLLQVPLVYCDQTASNRPVKSIERYMERVCLPLYGNTHTNTSVTGSQR